MSEPSDQAQKEFQEKANRANRVEKNANTAASWRLNSPSESDISNTLHWMSENTTDLVILQELIQSEDDLEIGGLIRKRFEQYVLDDELMVAEREEK